MRFQTPKTRALKLVFMTFRHILPTEFWGLKQSMPASGWHRVIGF